jgi:type IX secretion system PorP/SprF family membrane protein
MKFCFWFTFLFFHLVCNSLCAQDQFNFTQFYLNPYLINPSYAGIDGQSAFSLVYKKQWMNIDGGPSVANVSLHTPVNARTSVGVSITSDKKGLLSNSGLLVSFAYNLPVADHSSLRFGLSAGGTWNTVDFKKSDSGTDPALASLLDKNASVAGNVGLSFQHKSIHLGVAMPTLFSPAYVSEDPFTIAEVKPFQALIINSSYRFYFNDNKNVFEPYAVYRINTGLPSQFELAGLVHFNHVFWTGVSYKQDFGISALGGIKLRNMFALGGAYTVQNSGDNELNSPSFEVTISYLFGKPKKGTHAYSFVNTVKEKEKKHLSPAELLAVRKKQEEALRKKKLEAEARQKQFEEAQKKKQEALARAAEEKKKLAEKPADQPVKNEPVNTVTPPAQDSVKITHRPRFGAETTELKSPEAVAHEHEQAVLQRLDVHSENPTEHHGLENDVHPHAERHEFVKRGSHQEELEVADYVVGGVFRSDANAKHFSDGLNKMGFKSDYGHLTEKNLWYVYVFQTDDIDKARAERDRLRQTKMFHDAWLLTVHH